MKILVIGHSMVHQRQQWFFAKLGKLAGHCSIVGPIAWNNLLLKDFANKHYSTVGLLLGIDGNIFNYELLGTEELISEFKPDIVYCQAELRSRQALITLKATPENTPFIIFIWENILPPGTNQELEILAKSKLIICGNQDAKHLLPQKFQEKCRILPQVGIELDNFKPLFNIEKKFDVVFCGRPVEEKGIKIISSVCNDLNCSLKLIYGEPYEKIPRLLNEGKIFASIPITTELWKEQSGSYSNLEAMACGLPVITTRCGAIPEYLGNAAEYCEENNHDSFKLKLEKILFDKKSRNDLVDLGLKTVEQYSNDNIAARLLEIFKECI